MQIKSGSRSFQSSVQWNNIHCVTRSAILSGRNTRLKLEASQVFEPSKCQDISASPEVVMNKIFLIRGQKVMLDRDLSELYGVKAIRLREQVKRNQERFPQNFMFQLTEREVEKMVSQNAISSKQHMGGSMPFAFTELVVLMLANVLKSEQASR